MLSSRAEGGKGGEVGSNVLAKAKCMQSVENLNFFCLGLAWDASCAYDHGKSLTGISL